MSRVVFLHGVGSSGAGLRALATALNLTDSALCPDGPEPFDVGQGQQGGRQWFSVKGISDENRPARIAAALPGFRRLVEGFGDPKDSILVGFSQGAIMALHAVADGLPVKAVVALSGRLAGPVPTRADWQPITLLHGQDDAVIPTRMAVATLGWLRAAGAAPRLQTFDGLGHSIDDRVLDALGQALAPQG